VCRAVVAGGVRWSGPPVLRSGPVRPCAVRVRGSARGWFVRRRSLAGVVCCSLVAWCARVAPALWLWLVCVSAGRRAGFGLWLVRVPPARVPRAAVARFRRRRRRGPVPRWPVRCWRVLLLVVRRSCPCGGWWRCWAWWLALVCVVRLGVLGSGLRAGGAVPPPPLLVLRSRPRCFSPRFSLCVVAPFGVCCLAVRVGTARLHAARGGPAPPTSSSVPLRE